MAALSGRKRPRVALDRCPANPRPPLRMARRNAALLCSAEAFPARRDEGLRGALGVGRVGWDCFFSPVFCVGMLSLTLLCGASQLTKDRIWYV